MNIDIDRVLLPLVEKPVRYAGAISRAAEAAPPGARHRGAFVVPSLLEEGIGDTSLRTFLAAANTRGIWAEPSFAPGKDVARLLSEKGVPWFTAWTRRSLGEESFLVFCLGSPLGMTTALGILAAAGIPARAQQRKSGHPVVAAVLDGSFAPGPLERFFDLFLVGEGAGAVAAWCDLAATFDDLRSRRDEVLDRASGRPGFYVPSRPAAAVACPAAEVEIRQGLAGFMPPIAPEGGEYHVETSIGSAPRSRTHASWARASWARRAASSIVAEASHLILQPGVRRLRVAGRETDAHPDARPIAGELLRRLLGLDIELVFESLRPSRYEPSPHPALARARRSATIRPESGTDRLRYLLGGTASNDEIVDDAVRAASDDAGTLRLGFTIGLPGETAEEAEHLVALVERIHQAGQQRRGRPRISIDIAPFMPGPWTPFQWEAFVDPSEYRRRARRIGDGLARMKLRPRVRKPEAALVEAVLARGGEEAGDLIERAASLGARFDHDPRTFRFEVWEEAARSLGADLAALSGERDPESDPRWSRITFGAGSGELRTERARALAGDPPPAVEESAFPTVEGIGALETIEASSASSRYGRRLKPRGSRTGAFEEGARFRIRYAKRSAARFLSHLDLVHLLHASFLRLGVPPALEKGRQKISFGPPLPVGMAGEDEYLDVELSRPARSDVFLAFPSHLPRGVEFLEARIIRGEPSSLDSAINVAAYRVVLDDTALMNTEWQGREGALRDHLARAVEDFLGRGEIPHKGPRGEAEFNLREEVIALETLGGDEPPGIRARVWLKRAGRTRPGDLMAMLLGRDRADQRLFVTVRERLLVRRGEDDWTPLEALDLSGAASPVSPAQPHSVGGTL